MKKFNPRRSPYKQINEHKGSAIVFCEDRIRYVTREPVECKEWSEDSLIMWSNVGLGCDCYNNFAPSCFFNEDFCFSWNISAMKRFDIYGSFKILHIEFLS
jgi:hypothetical protein